MNRSLSGKIGDSDGFIIQKPLGRYDCFGELFLQTERFLNVTDSASKELC